MQAKNHISLLNKVLYGIMMLGVFLSTFGAGAAPIVHAQGEEQLQSLSGWFSVIFGDSINGSGSEIIYTLTDNDGQITILKMDETLTQPLGGIRVLNGQYITVYGSADLNFLDDQGDPVYFNVTFISPLESQGEVLASAAVTGSQPWISIMCKFKDVTDAPKDQAFFLGMYRDTSPGMNHYWRELSYDTINVTGSAAAGWFVLPEDRNHYVYDNDLDGKEDMDFDRATADCTAAADASVDFSPYMGINMMFNANLDCPDGECHAWGGHHYLTLDGVSKNWPTTWEPPWSYSDISVIQHEMGHGFGLLHSSYDTAEVYDNVWDVLSDDRYGCPPAMDPIYGCIGQHTISYSKDILGWIPAGQKYTYTVEGPVTITLEQLALPVTTNYKMAQIPINGSSTHFYTVEARRQTGYDVKLPGAAVIIHEVDTTHDIPAIVIDKDGNGDTSDAGAMWAVGETFVDADNKISVSVDSATATGFRVTISDGEIEDIAGDNLIVGQQGTVDVFVQALPAGNYQVKVRDVGGLFSPKWDWASTESGIVNLNEGERHTFKFSTTPDNAGENFEYLLYREDIFGLYKIIDKIDDMLIAEHVNDDISNAELIGSLSYTVVQDVSTATTSAEDPLLPAECRWDGADPGSRTVWYQFTPSEDGTFYADTFTSDYDTVLALWTGTPGALNNEACNDDYIGMQSRIITPVQAGTIYYLEVADYAAEIASASVKPSPGGDLGKSTLGLLSAGSNLHLLVDFSTGGTCFGGDNGPLFTTADNQDNGSSGTGDCDMDEYLFNDDSIQPIEFTINVPDASSITTANLLLQNWDVDQTSGEVDNVYFNGNFAGTLTGADDTWSTTFLSLDPTWVVTGENLVRIDIDVTNATPWWAVDINWGQLFLNGQSSGTASAPAVNLDKSNYTPGGTVQVEVEVDTTLLEQAVFTEVNLLSPSGLILDGIVINHTVTGAATGSALASLNVPANAVPGTYTIQVLVYDQNSNLLQDYTVSTFSVSAISKTFTSVGTQDGWVLETGEKTSKGGSLDSKATTFRLGDDKAKKQYRGILSFSTGASLPDTVVITKVTLKVRKQGIVGGGNPVTTFKGFMADIKKGYFGTSALQAADFQTSASKTYGPFKTALSGSWYNIDLTSGKSYINKLSTLSGLTQIRLRFYLDDNNNTTANYLSLYSGNAGAAYRPQLVIEYYVR